MWTLLHHGVLERTPAGRKASGPGAPAEAHKHGAGRPTLAGGAGVGEGGVDAMAVDGPAPPPPAPGTRHTSDPGRDLDNLCDAGLPGCSCCALHTRAQSDLKVDMMKKLVCVCAPYYRTATHPP